MDRLVSIPCLIPTSCGAFRVGRWLLLYLDAAASLAVAVPVGGEATARECLHYGKGCCEEAFWKHLSKYEMLWKLERDLMDLQVPGGQAWSPCSCSSCLCAAKS